MIPAPLPFFIYFALVGQHIAVHVERTVDRPKLMVLKTDTTSIIFCFPDEISCSSYLFYSRFPDNTLNLKKKKKKKKILFIRMML
jgi:hypothetical protein